jgi:hypothetical protein
MGAWFPLLRYLPSCESYAAKWNSYVLVPFAERSAQLPWLQNLLDALASSSLRSLPVEAVSLRQRLFETMSDLQKEHLMTLFEGSDN